MGKFIRHPDRETDFKWMKHDNFLCKACLKCRHPKVYCKFRPACAKWFMGKAGDNWGGAAEGPSSCKLL